ncbi:DUF861 domain-containing protein [Chitinimonas arctica]|uniref:DUF861 domain-containing protein n=1 Tax=Chitinimonas arctica TaxID=2594795 RepID=A0A516SIY3_9NEIS|nr:cupin domain-containing protein [Chitinimonas arctica]QDQ28106.1 DUF861 domain-containing protein [Chitinimonas arctica]
MSTVTLFSQQQPALEQDHPRPERLLTGNPLRSTWNHFINGSKEMYSGIWASEVGSWRIEFGTREDEFFFVTEGRCRIVDEFGKVVEAGPGDALVIPAGFRGVFEVLEAMKKYYVIIERTS